MLAAFWRFIVVAILVVTSLLVGPSARSARAATCVSSVGPGIPAPTSLPSGIPGFHAAWYGQSGYPTLCPGDKATSVVAYYNSGSQGWVQGRMGEVTYLGTWSPSPGQDQPTPLGGDGTFGSPNTGWPRYNRIAIQPVPYVGPGQVAWFQFTIQAPMTPGYYKLYLRPLVEGATWMEDYGVFWSVTVLNPDGTYPPIPPPQAQPGCRDWPLELGTQLTTLPVIQNLCLLPYLPVPNGCDLSFEVGCIRGYDAPPHVWTRSDLSHPIEVGVIAHEVCHAHQTEMAYLAGYDRGSYWTSLPERYDFDIAWQAFKTQFPQAYQALGDRGTDIENFANVCGSWYFPSGYGINTADYPTLASFSQKWLPK